MFGQEVMTGKIPNLRNNNHKKKHTFFALPLSRPVTLGVGGEGDGRWRGGWTPPLPRLSYLLAGNFTTPSLLSEGPCDVQAARPTLLATFLARPTGGIAPTDWIMENSARRCKQNSEHSEGGGEAGGGGEGITTCPSAELQHLRP